MTLLQLKLYYYKVLVIASIIKSFRKEKLCSNEFCVIIGCIYSESSQKWTVIFKFSFFFNLNFIQAKMCVCFQSLFFIPLYVSQYWFNYSEEEHKAFDIWAMNNVGH